LKKPQIKEKNLRNGGLKKKKIELHSKTEAGYLLRKERHQLESISVTRIKNPDYWKTQRKGVLKKGRSGSDGREEKQGEGDKQKRLKDRLFGRGGRLKGTPC